MNRFEMTSARRFEGYVRWSLYSLLALSLAPALPLAAFVLFHLRAGSSPIGTIVLGAVAGVTVLGLVAGNIVVARAGFQRLADDRAHVPLWILVCWPVAAVGHLVAAFLLVGVADEESGRMFSVVVACTLGTALSALTPRLTRKQLLLICTALTIAAIGYGALVSAREAVVIVLFLWFLTWASWLTVWMLRVMYELQDAHVMRADLALAEERLRISRDLHDVFGRTLATIAVKSELASELSRRGRQDRAATEMAEVRRLAETAGTEVRRVVRGELRPTWADELDGARALLGSAGIRCVVSGDAAPPDVAESLAWIVREGVTNILRHSEATTVTLTTAVEPDEVTLTLANDGAGVPDDDGHGSGIGAMNDRLRAAGGALDVRRDGDWFLLEATVPTTTEVHS